jgi:hypothetical protein
MSGVLVLKDAMCDDRVDSRVTQHRKAGPSELMDLE